MSNSETLANATAAGIGRLLAGGTVDAVEVTEYFLARAAESMPNNIYLHISADRARREAQASRKRYQAGLPLGPLDGVPIGWKDLFDVAGSPTTAGSPLLADKPPADRDAVVVANAAAAGMVSLGKLNLTEFAYSGIGLNPHYPTPVNPHDKTVDRVPGGSSSGSAVAVASGLCPCAMGTDTGGSVRIPASFNGIVGYKTSEGRIDKAGVFTLSQTLDTVGPLVKSVEDAVLLDMAMLGKVTNSVRRRETSDLTIIVPKNTVHDGVEDTVAANFNACLERLAQAGAKITWREMPLFGQIVPLTNDYGSVIAAEAYNVHKERVDGPDGEKIDRRVVSRIMHGKRMSANDLLVVMNTRARLIAEFNATLDGALVAMPTTAHTAPAIAPLEADDDLFHQTNVKTLRNTMFGNFLRTCGLALPSGKDANGMPTSILFSAPSGAEEMLLSCGLAIEPAIAELAAG